MAAYGGFDAGGDRRFASSARYDSSPACSHLQISEQRGLLCVAVDVRAWAKSVGFKTTVPAKARCT